MTTASPGSIDGADDEAEEIVDAAAEHDVVAGDAVTRGQRLAQREAFGIAVPVDLRGAPRAIAATARGEGPKLLSLAPMRRRSCAPMRRSSASGGTNGTTAGRAATSRDVAAAFGHRGACVSRARVRPGLLRRARPAGLGAGMDARRAGDVAPAPVTCGWRLGRFPLPSCRI